MQSFKPRNFSRISLSFVLIAIFSGILLLSYFPQIGRIAYADSNLVQTNSGSDTSCAISCTDSVTFPSSVASGDVVVVAILDFGEMPSLGVSVFGSSASAVENVIDMSVYDIVTPGCVSSCTVTVTDSGLLAGPLYVAIFDVSGVTSVGQTGGTGYGSVACSFPCSGVSMDTSTSSVSFIPGSFLLAAISWGAGGGTLSAGTGFIANTVEPSLFGNEYNTTGVSSPTTFPATVSGLACSTCGGFDWAEVSVALPPVTQTTTVTTTATITSSTTTTTTSPTTTTTTASTTQTVTTPSITTTTTTTTTSLSTTTDTVPTTTTTSTSTTVTVPTTTTETVTSVSTTTTVTGPTRVPTNTDVKCLPNPDQAGKPTLCTAYVTAMNGHAPFGKVKFFSSEGGTFSRVSCTSTPTILSCSVNYIPPASLIDKSTIISGQYYARPGSGLQNSHGKTTLNVTDQPKKNFLAAPSNSAPQNAVEIQTIPYSTVGLFSFLLIPASFAIYLIHRRTTLVNLFTGRVATKP